MVGIDGSFLASIDGDPLEDGSLSSYDTETLVIVSDNERRHIDLTRPPFNMDSAEIEEMQRQMEKFSSSSGNFLNFYQCDNCGKEWQDVSDSTCDDKCPDCNTAEPVNEPGFGGKAKLTG